MRFASFLAPAAALLIATGTVRAQCPVPTDTFAIPSLLPSSRAMLTHDDGSGPAMYVGGDFTDFGPEAADGIGRFDGTTFRAVGGGIAGTVRAMAEFDDGSGAGPCLYVTGYFTSAGGLPVQHIARWDGQTWSALGAGIGGAGTVLHVWDDGSGPALFVGGDFFSAGGQPAARFAKWDGQVWTAIGGFNGEPLAMAAWDDGSGAALYIGGSFDNVNGMTAYRIVRWNGTTFSKLTSTTCNGSIHALTVFDDGSGPALWAGGDFTELGGFYNRFRIARWNGATWLESGYFEITAGGPTCSIERLLIWNEGSGNRLYAVGAFDKANGAPAGCAAVRQGSSWVPLGTGVATRVLAAATFDDGGGESLCVGGMISKVAGRDAANAARWRNGAWASFGSGHGLGHYARSMTVADLGTGDALYVGGYFSSSASLAGMTAIGRWDGTGWSQLGSGLPGIPFALRAHDDGSGPALYAGGTFTTLGSGPPGRHISRWNGSAWSPVGTGFDANVTALEVFDSDGAGPSPARLIAGGWFTPSSSYGQNLEHIGAWNGTAWQPLNQGLFGGDVSALAAADLGSGPRLFAAGGFNIAGVIPVQGIASWDGAHWAAVGGGVQGAIWTMTVFDDGTGTALYVAGLISNAGGAPVQNVARWNGTQWSAVGAGLTDWVRTLRVYDDGSGAGPRLHAGGYFRTAQGAVADRLARWNGQTWDPVVTLDDEVETSAVFAPAGQPARLFLGGEFLHVDGREAARIAELRSCPWSVYCTAKVNSLNCVPSITGIGESSASRTSGFVVRADDEINQKPGLLVYGSSGPAALSFQGGVLCIAAPRRRSILLQSAGSSVGSDCSGVYAVDLNAFAAGALGGNPAPELSTPGVEIRCQFWGRDPGYAPPQNASLSDALVYRVGP
jgi:trimeric autotransporter adhesin